MKRLHLAALAITALFASTAHAQWNSNTVVFDAPTTCSNGDPLTACPVLRYQIERGATLTGAFASVGTTTTTTFTHTNAAAGQNCYRAASVGTNGTSAFSNIGCRTNTAPPAPIPGPPTNLRVVETTVFNLWQESREVTLGQVVGTVPLDTICGKQPLVGSYRTVARSNVRFTTGTPPRGAVLVAKCG